MFQKLIRLSSCLLFIIFTAACNSVSQVVSSSPISPTSTFPTPIITFQPRPVPTGTFTAVSPTQAPAYTPTATQFPPANPEWAAGLNVYQFAGDYFFGTWSPVANEMLYSLGIPVEGHAHLELFSAPDFQSKSLRPILGNFLWTQDGQRIFFHGAISEDGNPQKGVLFGKLWAIDGDGKNAHPLVPEIQLEQYDGIEGWKDDHSLIITSYYGNGHGSVKFFDITSGQSAPLANYWGNLSTPGKDYLAIDTFMPDVVYVTGEKLKDISVNQVLAGRVLSISLPIPKDPRSPYTYFEDWRHGTNQMLVYQQGVNSNSNLLLWDIDLNTVRTIVPNGTGGLFSPDGSILAALNNQQHLQLKDLTAKTTFLNIPSKGHESFTHPGGNIPEIVFSPDSRFAFIETPTELTVDKDGWLTQKQGEQLFDYSYILDLKLRKVIWSAPDAHNAVWSPLSNRLLYTRSSWQLTLLTLPDLQKGTEKVLNSRPVEFSDKQWSYDGIYFSAKIHRGGERDSIVFVNVP